jgi:hypothetical protein|tara:strand:+ start:352 stop:552 length:201 start_codon:yes stop_codon:yes gene_type:complete
MLEDIVRLQDNNHLKRQLEETEISLGSRVRKKKMVEKVKMELKVRTTSLRLSSSILTQMVLVLTQT